MLLWKYADYINSLVSDNTRSAKDAEVLTIRELLHRVLEKYEALEEVTDVEILFYSKMQD